MAEIVSGLETARFYVSRGLYPVPAPWGEKGSHTRGWQKLRLTADSLENYFNGGRQNVGVILGEPRGLVDIDLDAPEARWAWMELGLETGFVFGRRSNPSSHFFYYTDPPARTHPFDDPLPGDRKKRLIELRGLGGYQLAPPSLHPSGELYEFVHSGAPAQIDAGMLDAAVRNSAAAILIARHSQEGARHEMFLALAGALARGGWHEEAAENLLCAIYRVLWRESAKLDDARKEIRSTFEKQAEGKDFTGLSTLRNHFDPKVFAALTQWLGVHFDAAPTLSADGAGAAAAPAPAPAPKSELRLEMHLLEELRSKTLPKPRQIIEDCVVQPSLILVSAPPRNGKTTAAIQMAMAVAAGIDFLGHSTYQAPVLYVGADDKQGEPQLQEYLEKCRASRPGLPFHYVLPPSSADPFEFTFSNPRFISQLKDKIAESKAGLVVFDSYTALRGPRGAGGDLVKSEALEISMLAEMARDFYFAGMLISHDSKGSSNLSWDLRSAGSFAVAQSSEGNIRISRFSDLPEGHNARLVQIRHRRLRGAQFAVRFREESLDYDLIVEGGAAEYLPHLIDLYREFQGVPFTQKQTTEELGWTRSTASRYLRRFLSSGGILEKQSVSYTWHPHFQPKGIL